MAHDGGCGYECGGVLAQNGGPPHLGGSGSFINTTTGAFNTVAGSHGGSALQVNLSGTRGWIWHGAFTSGDVQVMGFAFYPQTMPSGDIWGPCFLDANPTPRRCAGMFWDGDTSQWFAAYGAVNNTSMEFASTGFTISTGAWHWVTIRLDNSGATATVDITVDGVAKTSLTGATKAGTTGYIYCPLVQDDTAYSAPTLDWRFDDFCHSVTSGDYPLEQKWIKGFRPKADGTHSVSTGAFKGGTVASPTGTSLDNSSTTAYTWVDASVMGDTGTFLNQTATAASGYLELVMQTVDDIDSGLGDPEWVEVYGAVSAASTSAANQKLQWHQVTGGGSTVQAWSDSPGSAIGTGYGTLRPRHSFRTLAPDGGAWTKSDFADTRVRWGLSSDANPDVYLVNVMFEACFAPYGATLYTATYTGSMTPAGTLIKRDSSLFTGGVTPTGALIDSTSKVLTGDFVNTASSIPNWSRQYGEWTPPDTYTITCTLTFTPTKGRILLAVCSWDKAVGTWTAPSGFTELVNVSGTSVSLWVGYKVSDGSETTVAITGANDSPSGGNLWVGEINASRVVAYADSGAYSDTAVTTRSTGTATGSGFAVAIMTVDSYNSINSPDPTWSNSFTGHPSGEDAAGVFREVTGNTGQAPVAIAYKNVTSSAESTFTSNLAADQMYGAIVIFDGNPSGQLENVTGTGPELITLTGEITPAGSLIKSDTQLLAGANTPTGLVVKASTQRLTGTVTPAGFLVKQDSQLLTGSAGTPTGDLTNTAVRTTTFTGEITPTGTLIKSTSKRLTGAATPTGALTKSTTQRLTGSITPVGTLTKKVNKTLTGSITPAVALIKRVSRLSAGSITPSGFLVKQPIKVIAGAVTPTGSLLRVTGKVLAGVVNPGSVLVSSIRKILTGSVTPAGNLSNTYQGGSGQYSATFGGTISPSGVAAKLTSITKTGSATPTGALSNSRLTLTTLTGAITPAGTVIKRSIFVRVGTLVPTGVLVKITTRLISGTITMAGAMVRVTLKLTSGSVTPSGSVATHLSKILSGSITPTGALELLAELTGALWNWASSGDVFGRTKRENSSTQESFGKTRSDKMTDTQPGFGSTSRRRNG